MTLVDVVRYVVVAIAAMVLVVAAFVSLATAGRIVTRAMRRGAVSLWRAAGVYVGVALFVGAFVSPLIWLVWRLS